VVGCVVAWPPLGRVCEGSCEVTWTDDGSHAPPAMPVALLYIFDSIIIII